MTFFMSSCSTLCSEISILLHVVVLYLFLSFYSVSLCECYTIQLLMSIWIVRSLELCKMLLQKLLCVSFEEYMYPFLFCTYLGMEFLSH